MLTDMQSLFLQTNQLELLEPAGVSEADTAEYKKSQCLQKLKYNFG